MTVNRRNLLAATAITGVGLAAATAAAAGATRDRRPVADHYVDFGPDNRDDITSQLQSTINHAASLDRAVLIAPGHYNVHGTIHLRPNTKLIGPHGLATINLTGNGAIVGNSASDLLLCGLRITGQANTRSSDNDALLSFNACANIVLNDIAISSAPVHAIKLWRTSGRIERCRFQQIDHTAIVSGNATAGLDISHNHIRHVGNNGIVIWRDKSGPDGTMVTNNDIAHVRSDAGGSGQNGNAINAFRADHVLITANMIADCAFSAVRCNSASNAQIIANNCRKIGEVALYAEFGFEGAVIANNLVDEAATGVEVTNFKQGGRLATVQGNIIRNLFRREHEPVDKRGVGIAVEADTVVSANTIENAATAGIAIGWGQWMRQVAASGNLVRNAGIGITVSASTKAGSVLIANNIISATRDGGVRLLDHHKPVGPALKDGSADQSVATLSANLIS